MFQIGVSGLQVINQINSGDGRAREGADIESLGGFDGPWHWRCADGHLVWRPEKMWLVLRPQLSKLACLLPPLFCEGASTRRLTKRNSTGSGEESEDVGSSGMTTDAENPDHLQVGRMLRHQPTERGVTTSIVVG
jgi:hypothetical protein